MKKIKYEKPVIRKLGYENAVMGFECSAGTALKPQCAGGLKAAACSGGGNFSSIGCEAGSSPAS